MIDSHESRNRLRPVPVGEDNADLAGSHWAEGRFNQLAMALPLPPSSWRHATVPGQALDPAPLRISLGGGTVAVFSKPAVDGGLTDLESASCRLDRLCSFAAAQVSELLG